jgi:hypothetical protein
MQIKNTVDLQKELIEYAKAHLSDVIPYDDPDYDVKLDELAKTYANEEIKRMKNYKLIDKKTKRELPDSDLPF